MISQKEQPTEPNQTVKAEDKGFMGMWSKAVDKIKTATTQFTDKDRPTKGQSQPASEPEEPK